MGIRKVVVIEGKKYNSINEFMRLNHINPNKRAHILEGLNFETHAPYTVFGKEFYSLAEVADHHQISFQTLRGAYFKQDLSLEKIIKRIKAGRKFRKNPIFDHLGNEYSSITELCQKYNITRTTYDRRKEKGYNLEMILTKPKWKHL